MLVRFIFGLLVLASVGCESLGNSKNHDGLFSIKQGNKCGFIDRTGKVVIQPQFEDCGRFYEGLAGVLVGKKVGFIDTKGEIVILPQFDPIGLEEMRFSDGVAGVNVGADIANDKFGRAGYIDRQGKFLCPPEFRPSSAKPFREGYGLIESGSGKEFRDKKCSKLAVELSGWYIDDSFHEGLARIRSNDGSLGFIDSSGKVAFKGKYHNLSHFSEGLVVVDHEANGSVRCGFLNKMGEAVIMPIFESCEDFSEGKAGVVLNGKLGFIDRTGKFTIEPKFDPWSGVRFSDGLASLNFAGKKGYIESTGRIAINPQWFAAEPFDGGLARVWLDDKFEKFGYIDKAGKVVWSQK